jgi:hypothetical protein
MLSFWTSLINHHVLWADYFKQKLEARYSARMLVKSNHFTSQDMFRKAKQHQLVGMVALHYLKSAQLMF